MAVPKKKKSKSKTAMGRMHWKLSSPQWVNCPQCKEVTQLHHVCQSCGYYKGRQVTGNSSEKAAQ